MNTRAPNFDVLEHAHLLAGQLRRSRLTLLCAEGSGGATALLRLGVLPLLRRRASDPAQAQADDAARSRRGVRLPDRVPDRRRGAGGSASLRTAEIAVVVDDWGDAPSSRVLERLRAAVPASVAATLAGMPRLADALAAASQQLSARFLFIFDRFEDSLTPAEHDGDDPFADEFVQVINDPALPAHFLLAVPEEAEPRLERFQRRITGINTQVLRLPSAPVAAEPAAGDSAVRREDVYRLISTTLARSVAHQAAEPWVPPPGAPLAAAEPAEPAAPIGTAALIPTTPAATPVTPPHAAAAAPWPGPKTRRPPLRTLAWVAGVWMLVLAVAAIFLMPSPETALPTQTPPRSPVATLPAPPSPPPLTPDFNDELAGLFGPDLRTGGPAAGLAAGLAFEPGAPPLAIAHYDALLAARGMATAPALHIVAPLALDDIVFAARADAPLTFIHDVEGHRIDAGPADGARALTAGNVYRRLFGKTALLDAAGPRSDEVALRRLADGSPGDNNKDADVVLVVGAATIKRWAANHPDAMRRLKLLMLDRDHPASRSALQAYLPTTLKAADTGAAAPRDTPTLAAMSFLVTSARIDEADGARIESLARTLCERLPQLQARGDPQWRDVALQAQLPAPWPYSPNAARAFAACAAKPAVPLSQSLPHKQPTQGVRP